MISNNKEQPLPGLASSWSITNDNTTFTFNIRPNVSFSNGDPMTSYEAWTQYYSLYQSIGFNFSSWYIAYPIFNMSTIYTPDQGGVCTTLCWGTTLTNEMMASGINNPSPQVLAAMENTNAPWYVTNSSQIVFHLDTPFYYFLTSIVEYWGDIWDSQYVLQHGGWGSFTAPNSYFDTNIIPGTGPYVVQEAVPNSFERLVQNPTYWGDKLTQTQILANRYLDPGHVKTIVIQAETDDTVRYSQLSSGQADIAAITQQNFPLIQANPQKFGYFESPNWAQNLDGIAMNTNRYPTNITTFRQAVSHAINITNIIDTVFFGQVAPMVGPEYPAWPTYYNVSGTLHVPTYNLTLAKQLLNEAVGNTTLAPMDFAVQATCSPCLATAQIVQSDLAKIGITINIEALSVAGYTAPAMIGTQSQAADAKIAAQAANFDWTGATTYAPDLLTPADNWTTFVNCNSEFNNFADYCNPIVQQAVNDWFNGSNQTALVSAIGAADKQLQIDQPYIYVGVLKLWFGGGTIAYNNAVVKGFLIEPLWSGFDSAPIFNTITFSS
jgi:ABC-type transport system substrate-binding protein